MRKTTALLFCIVQAAGLTACGEDDDASKYVGVYEISHHTLNDAACDVEGPEVTDGDPFFKIEKGDFFGFTILNFYYCTSATECDDMSTNFFGKQPDGWKIEMRASYEFQGECNLSETIGPLQKTEEGVRVEVKSSTAAVTPAGGEECDPDLVETYAEQMVCDNYEVIEGTKL